ncbi:hypothetical protein F6Y02_38615 (plasmid) [Bacillus megaterium]|nr:hypothetical protein [Priestia megaterium]
MADNVYSLDKNGFKKIEVIDENKESIINSFLKESNTEKATFKNNASLSSSNSEKRTTVFNYASAI